MTRDGAISVNMVRRGKPGIRPCAGAGLFPLRRFHGAGEDCLHHLDDRRVRKSQKKSGGTAAKPTGGYGGNSRPSSRLQFTEEERAAPELQRRSASPTRRRISWTRHGRHPQKRVLGTERVFDEASGAGRTRLVFHETDKPASIRQPGPNPLARPLQEVATPPTPRCGRWSRRTPAWPRAISPSAAWKKPWAMGTASCKTGGRSGR